MTLNDTRGLGRRVRSLLGAKLDSKDPGRAYDAVVQKKARAYEELKQAVAGILYLRNKIEGEIRERRADIARIHDDIRRALDFGDEGEALSLVRQKQALSTELARAENDLA